MDKKKISIIPLGCPKNDVDSELIAGAFKKSGYTIEWDHMTGETVVINTCGFIRDAIDESLDAIMQAIQAKRDGRIKKIVVTGCLPQRFARKLTLQFKDVDLFLGVNGFENIPQLLEKERKGTSLVARPLVSYPEQLERVPYRGNSCVYIKIADGCSNRCSYCVIPVIKGKLKSREKLDIVDEVKSLVDRGAAEIDIIAQDTMNFGKDRGGNELIPLLSGLEKINGLKWIRLNYLYPSHITDEFLSFVGDSEKVLDYFDIPLQHTSDRILRLMNRQGSSDDIKALIEKIWKRIQAPFLRTTVIVGFPGETENDFMQLLEFFNEYKFHRIGVFPYSREAPAPASTMRGQVPQKKITDRMNTLNDLAQKVMHDASSDFIDKTYEALIEGTDPSDHSVIIARPWFLAPEIDGYIMIYNAGNHSKGQFGMVRITDAVGVDLVGEFV